VTSAEKAIAALFQHLRDKEILVVAAAGNNGRGTGTMPDACLPARDPNVFSVSSVTRDPTGSASGPSLFTNNSDGSHGVATVSGDGDLTTIADIMLMENPKGQITDGVKGAFSGAGMIPNASGDPLAPKDPNQSGWVYWAGTSFSAPIISAIAATILANELANGTPLSDPAALITAIKSFADQQQSRANANSGALDCGVIYAYQA
jgi:subtilisin family serine protease